MGGRLLMRTYGALERFSSPDDRRCRAVRLETLTGAVKEGVDAPVCRGPASAGFWFCCELVFAEAAI